MEKQSIKQKPKVSTVSLIPNNISLIITVIIIIITTIIIIIIEYLYDAICSKSSWHFTIVEIPILLFCDSLHKKF